MESRQLLTGDFVFAAALGGTTFQESNAIAVDSLGNVYTTGSFYDTVDFDPGIGTFNLTSAVGSPDIFVSKLDSAGNFVWAKSMGGASSDIALGLAVDHLGNVHTTGSFSGACDFDPGTGTFNLTSAVGSADIFVSKLDRDGNFVWAKAMGGRSDDVANSLALDRFGYVYTTGIFQGQADFDPGFRTSNLTSPPSTFGVFVSKLTQELLFATSGEGADQVVLRRSGPNLEIFDARQNAVVSVRPLNSILGVQINGAVDETDQLTVDYRYGGSFTLPQGIRFNGGTGSGDELRLIGLANEGFTYAPSATVIGAGKFVTYGGNITFTGLESAAVTNLQNLSIEPQGSADVLMAAAATGFSHDTATLVTGSSGGAVIVPITFDNVQNVTVETGLMDGLSASANDSVTFNAGSLEAKGLRNLFIRTGTGDDTLTVAEPDIRLPVPGGTFWFLGGSGVDRLTSTGDANWQLNDTRLVSSGGGRIQHDGIEKATITGGISANHLSTAGFTGDAVLDGAGRHDLLRGGSGNDFLTGGIGNDRIFGGSGDDTIYGQDGDDLLFGEAGQDTLRGGAGNDRLFGGSDNDFLFGDTGDDQLFGGAGSDQLSGGTGDDVLTGGSGTDLYDLRGTANPDDLRLQRMSATRALFKLQTRGLVGVLEQDTITMGAADEFSVSALGGIDVIKIDALFKQLGSVDGGDGIDTCSAPAAWTRVSC